MTVSVRTPVVALTIVTSVVVVSNTGAVAVPAPFESVCVILVRPLLLTNETVSPRKVPLLLVPTCVVVVPVTPGASDEVVLEAIVVATVRSITPLPV